ncbi:hypothetical protein GCM10010236_45270 [Streptomyces eurythermus]|nr:hypothetical protein GCM10010236_45270 [Streptomyces eurythermus]
MRGRAAAAALVVLLSGAGTGSAVGAGAAEAPPSTSEVLPLTPSESADEPSRGKAFWQDDGPPVESEEQKASRRAVESGQRVEVTGLTTATGQVFANSDGTFTAVSSAAPERMRKDGKWMAVDTTLAMGADGSVRPKSAEDIVVSGGGTGPLARMRLGGTEYAVTAPWGLPEPVLDGSSAIYKSVLPDTDVVVQTHADGFSYHVVLRTRNAAANPALESLRFPITTKGLTVQSSPSGGAAFVDASGQAVVSSSSALMWDSAPVPASTTVTGLRSNIVEQSSSDSAPLSPGAGSRTAVMDVTVTDETLSIAPDHEFLQDPATVYPVVLDPPSLKASLTGWTTVWSDSAGTSFWKTKHALGVGYDAYVDNKLSRSLFQFDTRSVAGKKILGATFTSYAIWSANCEKRDIDLYRTGTISSSTTWSHQPSWSAKVDTVSAAKGFSSSCPDGDIEFDATAAVAYTAKAKSTTTTLGLRASESDPIAWKQFMSPLDERASTERKPRLSITYVTPPNSKPSTVKMSDPNVSCSVSTSPAFIRDDTPRLTATPTSSDGSNASLRPNFELYKGSSTTPTVLKPSTWTGSGTAGTSVTAALSKDTTYKFRARTEYKYTYGGATNYLYGPWSAYCYFEVDPGGPPQPGVTSVAYPECAGTDCSVDSEHGGVGTPGKFVITANASDVRRYDWWLNGVKLGSKQFSVNTPSYEMTVTPDKRLTNTLRVQTFDNAGYPSAHKDYLFKVGRPSDPVAAWKFDEGTGTAAANAHGSIHPMTLNQASWASQARNGAGLAGTGTTTWAGTQGPVVDTANSFAVAAWVRLKDKQQTTVLQQQGVNVGAFQLYYSTGYDRWIFNRYATDQTSDETTIARAVSARPPVLGAWTHLLGVYNKEANKIQLYVNGQLEAETSFTTPWAANGPMEIGRWHADTQIYADVDHVQAWKRAVYPSELNALVNMEDSGTGLPQPELLAHWEMNETSGTTAADSTERGNSLALQSGASFAANDEFGHATVMALDADAGGHATASAVLDNSGSFSVAGWVNLSADSKLEDTTIAHSPTVFSHPGTQRDAFRLWYRQEPGEAVGDWNFGLFSSDVLGGPGAMTTSDEVNSPNGWVHVVGVFDSAAQSIKLYVTGERQGDEDGALFKGVFQPAGPQMVGRGRRHDNGQWGNLLPGRLDDLRVYAGVLSEAEITRLSTVDEPPVPIE